MRAIIYEIYNFKKEILYVGYTTKTMKELRDVHATNANNWTDFSLPSLVLRKHQDKYNKKFNVRHKILEEAIYPSVGLLESVKANFIAALNPIGVQLNYTKLLYGERNNRSLVRRCIEVIISVEKETEEQTIFRLKNGTSVINIFDPPKTGRKSTYKRK